jgi:mRNA interferase MazF
MRHKVVLVPFPFDDLSGTKVRPAVCLTDATGPFRHVVLAFISSNVPALLEASDILFVPGTTEFVASGLRVQSVLRLHHLVTVRTSIIQRQLGVLNANTQAQVEQRLRVLFHL